MSDGIRHSTVISKHNAKLVFPGKYTILRCGKPQDKITPLIMRFFAIPSSKHVQSSNGGVREMAQATLFNLRWLTVKYYKKKGFVPLDISHWPPYKIPSIKRMLYKDKDKDKDKKSDALFLKNSKEIPFAIVLIKDWGRVVGVNQCYQVERLRGLLKNENIEIDDLKFILVSRNGFSESVKRFARRHSVELKSEADMTYEYPKLGEIVRRQRIAAKIAEEKAKEEAKEKEIALELEKGLELEEDVSEEDFKEIQFPHTEEDKIEEGF